jgi:Ran GTPase-activating protein (RanGAP) involved in mRNA processing and transport
MQQTCIHKHTHSHIHRGRSLLELDLKCNLISHQSLKLVLASLSNCPRLIGLALGDNPLGSESAQELTVALSSGCVPCLEKLGLGGTQLGDEGLLTVAPAIAAHKSLRVVGISANGVTMRGAKGLIEALRENESIESVVIGGNRLSDSDMRALDGMCRPGLALKM